MGIPSRPRRGPMPKSFEALVGAAHIAFAALVEPTNTRAEEALRGGVLWRKGYFSNSEQKRFPLYGKNYYLKLPF